MTPSPIPPRAYAWLATLTLLWGTNWPLFPLAVREVSVWTFRAVAVLVGGVCLLAFARLRGQSLDIPRKHWRTLVLATFCYLVVWNIASTYAAVLIPSGQASILGFTMPLWAALISWAVLGEKLPRRMLVALAFGAAGVGILMFRGLPAYAQAPLGFALGLLAGVGWAVGTLILARNPIPVPATVLTGWQMLVTAVPTTIGAFAFADGGWFMPSWQTILIIGYIALVPMTVGNVAWFSIVGMLPAQVAAIASVMVPVVAMISGALLHGEPLGPWQWAAIACTVTALTLALVNPRRAAAAIAARR